MFLKLISVTNYIKKLACKDTFTYTQVATPSHNPPTSVAPHILPPFPSVCWSDLGGIQCWVPACPRGAASQEAPPTLPSLPPLCLLHVPLFWSMSREGECPLCMCVERRWFAIFLFCLVLSLWHITKPYKNFVVDGVCCILQVAMTTMETT